MRDVTKRRLAVGVVLILAALVVYGITHYIERISPVSIQPHMVHTIIIDPGHGGIDGGASGVGGLVEKNINLEIALKLRDILQTSGFQVVMTRDTDTSIHDSGKSIGEQKVSDMRNRLKMINEIPNAVTVSIHQNHFGQEQYSGAQMFYGRIHEESKLIAEAIQKRFVVNLQKENKREIKQAGKDLYLMYHAKTPIVLVECGFLSNPVESALLSDETYQNKVAFTIFSGLIDYLSGSSPSTTERRIE